MARLRRPTIESIDQSDLVGIGDWSIQQASTPLKTRASPRKKATKVYDDGESPGSESPLESPKLVAKTPTSGLRRPKQIRLAPLNSATISNPPPTFNWQDEQTNRPRRARSPQKVQEQSRDSMTFDDSIMATEPEDANFEESVYCSSSSESGESDEELPSPGKVMRKSLMPKKEPSPRKSMLTLRRSLKDLRKSFRADDLAAPPTVTPGKQSSSAVPPMPPLPKYDLSRPGSSDKENGGDHLLHFSPPRLHSPRKNRVSERATTPPPTSPSKGKLMSPSKKNSRIPSQPHGPNLDAFWDPETVNEWNDQHSPRREWKSPAALRQMRDDSSNPPTSSPRKTQSPSKRTKAEIEAKKSWEIRKYQLAEGFLAELDREVADGQISKLAESTGGVRLIWSKTLNSTAGRANWKRQTTKTRQLDGTTTVTHENHASIELAEKVIDDEDRLLNVIAHEFCHLCNFMISGIKDQPHGRQFKEWGRQATLAFAGRGVEVTTKHRYQIEYKYIWTCENEVCGAEFKRHSKSIDPLKHTCGACRGKLVQIKPVPRKDAGTGLTTGYAGFVKTHFATVKKNLALGSTQKEVMKAVAELYRKQKKPSPDTKAVSAAESVSSSTTHEDVDSVAKMFSSVAIEDLE